MATIANVTSPYEALASYDHVTTVRLSAFPVTPAAGGFMTDMEDVIDQQITSTPHTVTGAFYPEGNYLESTVGQIWPR